MLLIYSKIMTRGWTSPCHPPPSQRMCTGIGATWAKLLPTPRHVLAALSQMLRAGGRGAGRHRVLSPQVEQHIGLLVEDHFDVAGADQVIVHLIPLPIADLQKEKRERGRAVPGDPPGMKNSKNSARRQSSSPQNPQAAQGRQGDSARADLHASCGRAQPVPPIQCSTPCPPAEHPPFCALQGPMSTHSPQARGGAKRAPWAHLHVAVVVPCVAAVARVHQHCIEFIHDRIPVALRHVRADVQELGVSHVLWREDVSGACTADGFLARARAAQLSHESHLSREGDPLSPGRGHGEEDARMSQTPTAPHSWGRAAGLRQSSHCAQDHPPPCSG